MPDTLTIRTPRGGLHYWLQGSCPSTVQKLGPKVDTRGDGGYVLVPPSIVDGKSYDYVSEKEIAGAPAWIAQTIATNSEATAAPAAVELDLQENVERARQLLRGYVDASHVAIEGSGGDNRTYQVACEVLNLGLSADKAFDLLDAEWNNHCVPPWEADELRAKIANAVSYAQNDFGVWAVPSSEEVFNHLVHNAPPTDPKRSRFYPLDETEQDTLPEPTWLLPNILPDESTVLMYAPSGEYKTFLALDMAFTLASGQAGWGAPAREPVDVVYVAAEGARAIARQRRPGWRKARNFNGAMRFFTVPTMPLVARVNEIDEFCKTIVARGVKPRLVVLDTFARAMAGKNENDAKDTGEFVEAVEAIKRCFGCTVLTLHHTGKEEVRGARGSSALVAGLDTIIEVKSDRDRKLAVVTVRQHKDADEPTAPWTFQAEVVGSTLVFNQLDAGAYEALCRENDPFSQVHIGAALRELTAITAANGVTTQVLATHLCPPLAADSSEDRERAVAGFARKLGALSKSRLRAYTEGQGRGLKWFVPTLDTEETSNSRSGSDAL